MKNKRRRMDGLFMMFYFTDPCVVEIIPAYS
jgi:hypothetical protein